MSTKIPLGADIRTRSKEHQHIVLHGEVEKTREVPIIGFKVKYSRLDFMMVPHYINWKAVQPHCLNHEYAMLPVFYWDAAVVDLSCIELIGVFGQWFHCNNTYIFVYAPRIISTDNTNPQSHKRRLDLHLHLLISKHLCLLFSCGQLCCLFLHLQQLSKPLNLLCSDLSIFHSLLVLHLFCLFDLFCLEMFPTTLLCSDITIEIVPEYQLGYFRS